MRIPFGPTLMWQRAGMVYMQLVWRMRCDTMCDAIFRGDDDGNIIKQRSRTIWKQIIDHSLLMTALFLLPLCTVLCMHNFRFVWLTVAVPEWWANAIYRQIFGHKSIRHFHCKGNHWQTARTEKGERERELAKTKIESSLPISVCWANEQWLRGQKMRSKKKKKKQTNSSQINLDLLLHLLFCWVTGGYSSWIKHNYICMHIHDARIEKRKKKNNPHTCSTCKLDSVP